MACYYFSAVLVLLGYWSSAYGSNCTQGNIRLLDEQGNQTANGRIEICLNNEWGTVCHNQWGISDALVACRQLNLTYTGAKPRLLRGIRGRNPILLDNVRCRGTESRLIDCLNGSIGKNCNQNSSVGVSCAEGSNITDGCTDGDIRLQGGNSTFGRVEICINNIWGTVCDDLWSIPDALVVCRQLNLTYTNVAPILLYGPNVPNGGGPIWLDNVWCRGNESRLIDCRASPIGINDCSHHEDVGVSCTEGNNIAEVCTHGDIRLQGGNSTFGRVEICINNIWATVCDGRWKIPDALVVCRQLNLTYTNAVPIFLYGPNVPNDRYPFWLANVRCRGTESKLIDCPANPIGINDCSHNKYAGVICTGAGITEGCTEGDIRLQGGNSTFGRVEICINNIWGTVCDDQWGTQDAMVACTQLEHSTTNAKIMTDGFTNGVGLIWLDDVQCKGTENRLIKCDTRPIGLHNCNHQEDAGVACLPLLKMTTSESPVTISSVLEQMSSSNDLTSGNRNVVTIIIVGLVTLIAVLSVVGVAVCFITKRMVNLRPSEMPSNAACSGNTSTGGHIFGNALYSDEGCYAGKGPHVYDKLNLNEVEPVSLYDTPCSEDIYFNPAENEDDLYSQLTQIKVSDISRELLKIGENIGSGQFGMVYKGVLQSAGGEIEVAVKTLKEGSGEVEKVKFLQEATIMGQFKHPNVVMMHGMITVGEPVLIMLELLPRGDLRKNLLQFREKNLPEINILLNFCQQIASGMAYLSSKSFVHRDLAARNILLSDDDACKIADFGMSRDLIDETYYVSHGGMIPVKWTAPEALNFKKYSAASDVWSYGAVMYEILSVGHKPFENYQNNQVIHKLDEGYRLPPPPGCPRELYRIMINCWHPVTSERPKFSSIVHQLSLPDTTLLKWSEEDKSVHLEAAKLGADLLCAQELYKDLQNAYKI